MEKQEKEKRDKFQEIKSRLENQPKFLPREREKNIYGLSRQEEEAHMLNKMKKEQSMDVANKYLSKVDKLQRQKELREYLNQQLDEKHKREELDHVKERYFDTQVLEDDKKYQQSEQQKQREKKQQERKVMQAIEQQISAKKAKSPAETMDKFGICGMNKEEFLMNKHIL